MKRPAKISQAMLADISDRLRSDRVVRRSLPVWGRVAIERRLPFLVVYRRPLHGGDPGTERLAVGTASYLLASSDPSCADDVDRLIETIAAVMHEAFGAFLIIELWAGPVDSEERPGPAYRVCRRKGDGLEDLAQDLSEALRHIRVLGADSVSSVETCTRVARRGMKQLLTARRQRALGAALLGVEVRPVHRAVGTDELYPAVLRQMRRQITVALDLAVFSFTAEHTTARPATYQAMRRSSFTRAMTQIDSELSAIGSSFDVLVQVTPVNVQEQWHEFRRRRFRRPPHFLYRPLPFDPGRMKQRLWAIRPERVEDPTFMYLFRGVQRHLDRQLSLVSEIRRPEFLYTSMQLHGAVEPGLSGLAEQLLVMLPPSDRAGRETLDAAEFEGLVREEIARYRDECPGFGVMPTVREDLYAGLLVSHGHLFIGAHASIPQERADALIQHEVGTHVVTYHNGARQPLQLLSLGLPGYDEMQEGLGVLGEFLAGGLDADRLRVLAARVLAVQAMCDGAEFIDTFRVLTGLGFSDHSAFTIATRVHRGGGLAKDAMYLRGFSAVLDYVARGGSVPHLFVGKYAAVHVPVIEELLARKVLVEPDVLPRYLQRADATKRLEQVQAGLSVSDLTRGVRSA